MVYTHKELKEKYGSDYQIQKAVKDGYLYKIESGIYSDKQNNHFMSFWLLKLIEVQFIIQIKQSKNFVYDRLFQTAFKHYFI